MGEPKTSLRESVPIWRRRYHRQGLYYVLPALVLFGIMVAYPIVRSLWLSFFDYSILEPDASRFVGLGNYAKLWTGEQNQRAFRNTLYFTAIFVPPYVLIGLGVALLLNRVRRGSVFLRTVIFTPVVVSLAVAAVMWTLFFNASFGMAHKMLVWLCGLASWVSQTFGGPAVAAPAEGVLGSSAWAMIAVAVVCLWNGVGINVILYLVGLQRIPDELYEAAEVDGASAGQRFVHITLPQLRPTTYLVVLLSMIGAFKVFGQPYIMTGGGPQDATLTFVMRLYHLAFRYGKFELGYASALAYGLAVFIFAMSLLVRRLNRPVE